MNVFDDQVDIAYIPFVDRFQIVFAEVFKHDITEGRPKLAAWIEVYTRASCVKYVTCNSLHSFIYIFIIIFNLNLKQNPPFA